MVLPYMREGVLPPSLGREEPKALHKAQISHHKGNVSLHCCEATWGLGNCETEIKKHA